MDESRAKSPPWNDDTVYAFGLCRLIGRILGIWSPDCNDIGSKIRLLVVMVLQLTMISNLLQECASGCISIVEVADFFGIIATNVVSLLQMFVIRVHEKQMYLVVVSAVDDWSIVGKEDSRVTMRGYARVGRLISIFPLCFSFVSLVPLILAAPPSVGRILDDVATTRNSSAAPWRNLPMGTGCSTVGMPTLLYLAFYLYQFLQLLCLCTSHFGCDAMFYVVSLHLCAQLALLKNDIATLGESGDERSLGEKLAALVRRHDHLLRLLNLVEDIFHVIIFGLLAGSGSHIILLGIQMLLALQNEAYITVIYSPISISILLLQLFAYSFVGDYMSSHAEDVRNAAYNCRWYNFPSSLTKDMIFVMMKSSCDFRLTAGKIFRINIQGFTSIFKTMASFFSVMKLTIVK